MTVRTEQHPAGQAESCTVYSDDDTGLQAVLVIDSQKLGPAAGGIRTRSYPDLDAAVQDARALAHAMTLKCALGGLRAGGAKMVVLDRPHWQRERGFELLGQSIQQLGGAFRTAGDLGTTEADLQAVARHTEYVHLGEAGLANAVARGLVGCLGACAAVRGRPELSGLTVAVQGCGSIGGAVARALRCAGAEVTLADLDTQLARALADELNGQVCHPQQVLTQQVDVLAPCATGGVIDHQIARDIKAWAVVGGANNVLSEPQVAQTLADRGVLHVPDFISSAGAVIDGIGRSVMGLADRTELIDGLAATARQVLDEAARTRQTPLAVAETLARRRLGEGGN